MSWDDAVTLVADALTKNAPSEVAFLLGMAPDHLYDLVSMMTTAHSFSGSILNWL